MGFGFWSLGIGGWNLGFGVWDLGFGVWGEGFRVWGSGVRAEVKEPFQVKGNPNLLRFLSIQHFSWPFNPLKKDE